MKKLKVLALVMVFAFAALGGAYAMWFDTLTIHETADTGTLNLQWAVTHMTDPMPNYEGYNPDDVFGSTSNPTPASLHLNDNLDTMDVGNPNAAYDALHPYNNNPNATASDNAGLKNVAYFNAVVGDISGTNAAGEQDNNVGDDLILTLHNGYPGYQESITATITNLGTIPVKIHIAGTDSIPNWLLIKVDASVRGVNVTDLEGLEIEPGEVIPVTITERVLENGGATQQNNTVTFALTLKGIQWNEYSTDESYTLQDSFQSRLDLYPAPAGNPLDDEQN